MPIDLAPTNPYGLALARPVLTAAGCFGYGVEYAKLLDINQIGGIVTRTTTLHAQRGRPPQMIETAAGLLWTSPGSNPGLRFVIEHYAAEWASWATPVILSVAGSPSDIAQIAGALEGIEGIAGLELNLAETAEHVASIVKAARNATQLPLLAKLPALDIEPLLALARAAVAAGADALTLIHSPRGLHINAATGARVEGWLSGPAIQPLALRLVAAIAAAELSVPVIGCGGIASNDDTQRFLAAGASAVQIGAALLAEPGLLAYSPPKSQEILRALIE